MYLVSLSQESCMWSRGEQGQTGSLMSSNRSDLQLNRGCLTFTFHILGKFLFWANSNPEPYKKGALGKPSCSIAKLTKYKTAVVYSLSTWHLYTRVVFIFSFQIKIKAKLYFCLIYYSVTILCLCNWSHSHSWFFSLPSART